jgi:hypothetical protein
VDKRTEIEDAEADAAADITLHERIVHEEAQQEGYGAHADEQAEKDRLALEESEAEVAAEIAAQNDRIQAAYESEQDELLSELAAAAEERKRTNAQRGFALGGSFVLDQPERLPVLWGTEDLPLAVEGEGFMIVGIQGVGKTTIAQQYALGLAGLRSQVLGMPVVPAKGRVLYLAMDRPAQIARSWSRMVSEEDRAAMDERIVVWRGPLPFSLTENPKALASWARDQIGAVHVVVDSYKDVAPDLSSETTGARINEALQECLAEGIQWTGLHHNRKATADNPAPKALSDVYGSGWITAGLGSILYIYGQPGSDLVEGIHMKQPAESLGTFGIRHDHEAGTSARVDELPTVSKKGERHRQITELLRSDPDRALDSMTIAAEIVSKVSAKTVSRDMTELVNSEVAELVKDGTATFKWKAWTTKIA